MKIVIIGADRHIGRSIAEECRSRGMEVMLPGTDAALRPQAFLSLTAEELAGFDAVVDAADESYCGGDAALAAAVLTHLSEELSRLSSTRLVAVGSAGGLFTDGSRTERLLDCLPEAQRGSALALEKAAETLKSGGADWTYFRPAAKLAPEGKKTGKYLLGREIRILNAQGESSISFADYAAALADELEHPRFRGKAFTAVSDTADEMLTPEQNFFDLTKGAAFTRFGSYMGVFFDMNGSKYAGQAYQTGKLYLGTRRGTPTGVRGQDNDLLSFVPVYRGSELGYALEMTPTELTMRTAFGKIRLCFAEDRLLYIRGENGLSLKLRAKMRPGEMVKRRGKASWEAVFRWRCSLVLTPLNGSIDMDVPWDGETGSTPAVRGLVSPDGEGNFLLAVEESVYAGRVRASYPDYAAGLADVTRDWEDFLSHIPKFDESLEKGRIEAAWTIWTFIVNPSGLLRRPHVFMTSKNVASSWQMGHNAAALQDNLPLAMDLMLNMIDNISPQGQLPDFVDDGKRIAQAIHPPTQGWALKWIMRRHDLSREVPREQLEYLYDGYGKWADWFFRTRDDDGDGLPQCDNGDESGLDDSSVFACHTAVETPELSANLAVLLDALGDVAELLGKPEDAADWYRRADELTALMIKTFWNGERFIALADGTHEVIGTDSILHYMPFVLGKKLPPEIVDKMTADLMKEGEYLTPYGLATEKPSGDRFRPSGFARGWVQPVNNLLILTGMYDAGKVEEAKMIAERYCRASNAFGVPLLINPIRGGMSYFTCSWSACAFLTLADMLYNM